MKTLTAPLLLGLLSLPCHAGDLPAAPARVNAAFLKAEQIPTPSKLVRAFLTRDEHGERVLVLSQKTGPSHDEPDAGAQSRIDLAAEFYLRSAGGRWKQDWTVRDNIDCPGLDVDAGFFADHVAFTDLNKDGRVEVTVPYRLFCGGGVDSYTVKVILREGATKLAIRGKSLVRIMNHESFGGEHRHDKLLLSPAFKEYKKHLDGVWRKVADDRR